MPVTLKNISKQAVTLILEHPSLLTKENGWKRTTAQFANGTADGQRVVNEVRRSYPGVLTLQPGEVVADLPGGVAKCAQVPLLVKQRVLTVTVTKAAPEEATAEKEEDKS